MQILKPDKVFYEPAALKYALGKTLKETFNDIPWIAIENHNNIEQLRTRSNQEFPKMKRHLIVGVRKSLKHTPNHKVSDFWYHILPRDAQQCASTAIWSAIITNART